MALSNKAGDEAAQVKKAAESATAELRQSLQKEHDRAEALTSELAKAKRDIETQVALASKAGDEVAQLKQGRRERDGGAATVLQQERDGPRRWQRVVNPRSPDWGATLRSNVRRTARSPR